MKKSRITKLALLGVSTAALVGTLSTSTYAWYVSNKTATVATATGATGAGTADGSILLSWTGTGDTWVKDLQWTDTGAPAATIQESGVFKQALSPLYYDSTNKKFTTITTYKLADAYDSSKSYFTQTSDGVYAAATVADADAFADGTYYVKAQTAADASTGYIQFSMYIKADAATTVTITPTFVNTTTSAKVTAAQQVAMVATGGISKGQKFTVDAFDAMYYSLTIDDATTGPSAIDAVSGTKIASGTSTPGAAHSYYESVTGEDIESAYATAVSTTSLTTLSLTSDDLDKKLTWTIWLAGNDVDCYNSCAGQDFTVAFKYTAA